MRPHRPCPADYRIVYLDIGWDGIADYFGTNWRCICRWIDECGADVLWQARREVVRQRQLRDSQLHKRTIYRSWHLLGWSAERIEALHDV